MFRWFTSRQYIDTECTHCRKSIKVLKPFGLDVNYLGAVDDEDGYEWQEYCSECAEELKSQDMQKVFDEHKEAQQEIWNEEAEHYISEYMDDN